MEMNDNNTSSSSRRGGSSSTTTTSKSNNNKVPKDILFYGDSLTWGMAHNYTGRYIETYPKMLEQRLNENGGWKVIEAALCSRTSCFDDDSNAGWMIGGEAHIFNGLAHFPSNFLGRSCRAVVFLLGTNDLKTIIRGKAKQRTRVDASTIAANVARLGHLARKLHNETPHLKGNPFDIIFVCPPPVRLNPLAQQLGYDDSSMKISLDFPEAYEEMCRVNNFLFVPAPDIDMAKSIDGVHVTPEGTRQIAETVWSVLRPVLGLSHISTATSSSIVATGRRNNNNNNNNNATATSSTANNTSERVTTTNKRTSINFDLTTTATTATATKRSRRDQDATATTTTTTTATNAILNSSSTSNMITRSTTPPTVTRSKCSNCRKSRMRASNKARWKTCDDGFWVSKVDGWKFGCGWDEDVFSSDSETSVSVASAGGRGATMARQWKSATTSSSATTTGNGRLVNNKSTFTSRNNNIRSNNTSSRITTRSSSQGQAVTVGYNGR